MENQIINANYGKFENPDITAEGAARASVAFTHPETLWFNTGTLCNIKCINCYIESSPVNDALVYINTNEVGDYLDQLIIYNWQIREIAFTGGEPFMNPEIIEITRLSLAAGYEVLILTNAMSPMMRKKIQQGLIDLNATYPNKLTLRISLDHYNQTNHDLERGIGAFQKTLKGMNWLRASDIRMTVAGRTVWGETDEQSRSGYDTLFKHQGYDIDAFNHGSTVLFPELDKTVEVPEITTSCWSILNKNPDSLMCASSRMVVKRKGADKPTVLACTLLPYEPEFELGYSLETATKDIALNHPHCAKFCVLGGASCSS